MRRWWMQRAAPVLVLLALLSHGNAASAIRRSSSFVVPTSGSSHTLTLTTYLTDAADLHYAAVLSGHAPLEAAEIKSASQRCRLQAETGTVDGAQAAKDGGVVQASTVAVDRAQKVERQLVGLRANTSYDVYFVAEVPNSKGVYGSVLSVLGTTTHPTPPELKAVVAAPVNGSAKAVAVNITLSTPGIVHVALVPFTRDSPSQVTVKDVVGRVRGDVAFAMENLLRWDSLSTQVVVDFLSPATEYELVVVTEALGHGDVYSKLHSQQQVRTHASAPDISALTCEAAKGSASSMEIMFKLQFPEEDVRRASDDTVAFFQYQLHYEVEALTPSTKPNGEPDIDRGTFSLGKFDTVADLARQADADTDHKRIIEGLDPATSHTIRLYAETKESNGVTGRTREVSSCVTHATAPKIVNATAQPTNGTVHALDILVELERPGNVHYVLAPRSSTQSLRNSFQRATSVDELMKMVNDDNKDATGILSGVIEANEAAVASFVVDGLVDNTAYSIALLPETIASFGVFGEPYRSLLDASTNENASEVAIVDVQPSFGSLTSAELQLSMAKPLDILFICMNAIGSDEQCDEVPRTELQQLSQSSEATNFSFTMANLTEDTEYQVSLFAESRLRNGVVSDRTTAARVKTHRPAPDIVKVKAVAVAARVDAVSFHVELSEPGQIHYVVVMEVEEEKPEQSEDQETQTDEAKPEDDIAVEPLAAELIVEQSRRAAPEKEIPRDDRRDPRDRHSHHRNHRDDRHRQPAPSPSKPTSSDPRIVKRGQAFADSGILELLVEELTANTTYSIHVVSETQRIDGVSSGVYGTPSRTTVMTHDVAPVIVKSMAGATSNRTDSIVLTVNLTRPGIVHYQLTDVDFADPLIIKSGLNTPLRPSPHVLRGSFVVQFSDMGIEIKNGTNDTQPMEPMVFATNLTIDGLREDTTYHVSLTTETFGSGGVFGDFPAPLLVTTHAPPPQFVPNSLHVGPMAGSSSSLSMDFRLSTLGEVHYALFFRGLVPDRTTEIYGIEEQKRHDDELHARELRMLNSSYNASEEPPLTPRWPPPANVFDITQLTARQLKDAEFDQLGEGVWENGTISVSREDVFHKKLTHKKIEKLPPSAMFDVCLVPETAASDGVFAPVDCHRVTTHSDYTNQSVMFDEVEVLPVEGATDGVHIKLQVSKLLDAPEDTSATSSDNQRLEQATGRIPYFILLDGRDGRPELTQNTFQSPSASRRHDKNVSPFKLAVAGRSHVVAAGILATVTSENATFVTVEHRVHNLQANTEYYFFFAYETAGSDGLFTEVNPHKHRPNETEKTNSRHSSKPETSAIRVTTHERAPQLKSHEATATYGNTSRITVSMHASCVACEETVVHIIVANEGCPLLSTELLLPSAGDVATAQALGKIENEPCMLPLIYKRADVNMTEETDNGGSGGRHRHHHRHHGDGRSRAIDIDVEDDLLLVPNTTYQVWIATETANSGGVISESFYTTHVKTFPRAPRFTQLVVQPRKGSTTDLLLLVTLEHPGEVHYMLGKSGNDELNVTSPFNVSGKALPGDRDAKFHNYGRDVVRSRRSITIARAGEVHVEVIEYLVAGTSYDIFVVAETADDSGIYGEVMSFPSVSTFATPPMLLAHTAYPTPGTVDSLSVGFRVEDSIASVVHVSVITSVPWTATARVAEGSDTFGNRLAMDDRFIGRQAIEIDGGKPVNGDDGWKEVNISVPTPGTNYTVFLVTETKDSDGVYGTVATHYNVQSHPEPPLALNVSVRPTDARVDALTVDVTLSHDQGGHVHYAVLRHRQRFTRSSISNLGKVDVNGSNTTSFVVDGLKGRTAYDVYLRMESFESHGVIGDWSPFPVTATTHGLPAEVLESIECEVTPSCQSLGRHACSQVANVCGECLDGYDGITGSSNAACRRLEPGEVTPTIKISGVRINPRHRRFYPSGPVAEPSDEPAVAETSLFAADPEPAVESQTVEVDAEGASIVDAEDAGVCPGNAQLVGSGKCECKPGYQVDTMGTMCVPFYQNTKAMAMGYTSHAL